MNPRLNLKQSNKSETLKHIEQLADKLSGCNLSENRLDGAYPSIKSLSKTLGVTSIQTILFTTILSLNFKNHPVSLNDISDYLAVPGIKLMQYFPDLEDLQKKRWIRTEEDSDGKRSKLSEIGYYISREIFNKLNRAEQSDAPGNQGVKEPDIYKLLSDVMELANDFYEEEICHSEMCEDIYGIIDTHTELPFIKLLKAQKMNPVDELIFMLICQRTLQGDPVVDLAKLVKIGTGSYYNGIALKRSFINNQNRLNKLGFIEMEEGDFKGFHSLLLSAQAIELFLPSDKDILIKKNPSSSRLVNADGIGKIQLFFNPEEQAGVERLKKLLRKRDYTKVVGRMQSQGMRPGFTILLHGSPGTGKTESVKQLARETNREVMHVDISKARSKWFGESEKKIAEIFAQYRQLKKNSKTTPILLFNEADGVFGSRSVNTESSTDQISNTIQNILLEEMENFEGIMVATTNLTANFDKAFERRFLYKIEFSKPNSETRKQIWLSKIPELSTDLADQLSNEFEFSGGQIENVSRKFTIDRVLSNVKPDYETLSEYCREEILTKKITRSLGFQSGNTRKAT